MLFKACLERQSPINNSACREQKGRGKATLFSINFPWIFRHCISHVHPFFHQWRWNKDKIQFRCSQNISIWPLLNSKYDVFEFNWIMCIELNVVWFWIWFEFAGMMDGNNYDYGDSWTPSFDQCTTCECTEDRGVMCSRPVCNVTTANCDVCIISLIHPARKIDVCMWGRGFG